MIEGGRRKPRATRSSSADEAAGRRFVVHAWTGEETVAGVLVMGLTFLWGDPRMRDPNKTDKRRTQVPGVPDTLRP